jgi:hypothetical protein
MVAQINFFFQSKTPFCWIGSTACPQPQVDYITGDRVCQAFFIGKLHKLWEKYLLILSIDFWSKKW